MAIPGGADRPVRGALARSTLAADRLQPDPAAALRVSRSAPRHRGPLAHLGARRHRRRHAGRHGRSQQPPGRRRRRPHRERARCSSPGRTARAARARSTRCSRARLGARALRLARLRLRLHPQLGRLAVLVPRARAGDADGLRSRRAFSDLLGYVKPRGAPTTTRAEPARIRSAPRCSTRSASEYDLLAPQLGAEGRRSSTQHRALVRELELSLGSVGPRRRATRRSTRRRGVDVGPSVRQFMSLIRHGVRVRPHAHRDVLGPRPAVPRARLSGRRDVPRLRAPVDRRRDVVRADVQPARRAGDDRPRRLARGPRRVLCSQQLDSVAEGSGTLLDHTVVVWVTELATPTHLHYDMCTRPRRRLQRLLRDRPLRALPADVREPARRTQPLIGPAHNRLLREPDAGDGPARHELRDDERRAADGTPLSFTGPLTEL